MMRQIFRRVAPSQISSKASRGFAVSSLPPIDTSRRHDGIELHPESVGNFIMPGDVVYKKVRYKGM